MAKKPQKSRQKIAAKGRTEKPRARTPLLKERIELLPQLLQEALKGQDLRVDELALKRMMEYDWPGNLEEFHFVVSEAAKTCSDKTITIDDLLLPVPVSSGEELYPQRLPPGLRS